MIPGPANAGKTRIVGLGWIVDVAVMDHDPVFAKGISAASPPSEPPVRERRQTAS
jgi:hypothetical protein